MFWRLLLALFLSAALCSADAVLLTVDSAVERALQANRQLLGSKESVESAQLQLGLQEGAFDLSWAPITEVGVADRGVRVGTGVMLSRRLRHGSAIACTPKTGRGYKSLSLSLSQPLFRGLLKEYNEAPLHAARFGVRASERALYLSQVGIVMQTIRAVYNVAKREAILDLEEESAARLLRFLEATRLKGRIGIASDMDLYRAEIEWRTGEEARNAANEQLEAARVELCRLLAFPSSTDVMVEAPIASEPINIDLEAAITAALERRLEIVQASEQVEEARRGARCAKHKLLPEVNVTCSYGNNGTGWNRQQDWAVGLTTGTDWSRKAEKVAYSQSLTAVAAAERAFEECQEKVRRDVEQVVRGLHHSEKRVTLGEEKLKSGEGKLRLAQLKIQRGLASSFELIQSEKGFKGAQRDLIEAMIDHTVSHYQLLVAQGVLL